MTRMGSLWDPTPAVELRRTLDLERPELKALMNRPSGNHPPRAQTSILAPPAALIVKHGDGESAVRDALESEGWLVKTCEGPACGTCPIMSGQNCPLRESVEAAVVFVGPEQSRNVMGILPRLRCAADSASPAVVVLQGSLDAAQQAGPTVTIGALRGPGAIVAALRRALTRAT
ncbi:MAG: hypothetical protein ACR2KQ_05735 [Actinomycetota bacterium]